MRTGADVCLSVLSGIAGLFLAIYGVVLIVAALFTGGGYAMDQWVLVASLLGGASLSLGGAWVARSGVVYFRRFPVGLNSLQWFWLLVAVSGLALGLYELIEKWSVARSGAILRFSEWTMMLTLPGALVWGLIRWRKKRIGTQ